MTTTRSTQTKLQWSDLRNKKINVVEWPSQSPDLNSIKNLWHDLKIAVHQYFPHEVTELEQYHGEEWVNIAQSRCAKLVDTYPNRITAVIAVKGASTKVVTQGGGHLSNEDLIQLTTDKAFIHSLMEYCSPLLGGAPASHLA